MEEKQLNKVGETVEEPLYYCLTRLDCQGEGGTLSGGRGLGCYDRNGGLVCERAKLINPKPNP